MPPCSARPTWQLSQKTVTPTLLAPAAQSTYDIAEYQKTGEMSDQQIVVSHQEGFRVIYQYRAKRAALDLRNIEKQVAKAKKALSGQIPANRTKFLSIKAKSKQLNQKLIDKARTLAGIKGYVTNLDIPDQEVIAHYHQLFQ